MNKLKANTQFLTSITFLLLAALGCGNKDDNKIAPPAEEGTPSQSNISFNEIKNLNFSRVVDHSVKLATYTLRVKLNEEFYAVEMTPIPLRDLSIGSTIELTPMNTEAILPLKAFITCTSIICNTQNFTLENKNPSSGIIATGKFSDFRNKIKGHISCKNNSDCLNTYTRSTSDFKIHKGSVQITSLDQSNIINIEAQLITHRRLRRHHFITHASASINNDGELTYFYGLENGAKTSVKDDFSTQEENSPQLKWDTKNGTLTFNFTQESQQRPGRVSQLEIKIESDSLKSTSLIQEEEWIFGQKNHEEFRSEMTSITL